MSPQHRRVIGRTAGARRQHPFSPTTRSKRAIRSRSNTSQKAQVSVPLIDWCTVVLDSDSAKAFCRGKPLSEVVQALFEPHPALAVGPLRDCPRNHYPRSAVLVDCTGTQAGIVAVRDDGAIQVSLSGQGCQHVNDWAGVADRLDGREARVSRVDIAVDDLTGDLIDVHRFKDLWVEGAFITKGRPPAGRFVDDLSTGEGCTLYVGQRGHKQLCVYERGKKLGDPSSRHTRCELRLYRKRLALPTDVLRRPDTFFGGAYPPLEDLTGGALERLQIKETVVAVSADAMVRALRRQCGPSLGLLGDALGEGAHAFISTEIARPGCPRRFQGISGNLPDLVRRQLARKLPPDDGGSDDAHEEDRSTKVEHD